MILAGDIGGTKTHLALFDEKMRCTDSEKFPSKDYANLNLIVREFLSKRQAKIERACFGVAGPVREGHCQTTNLPWIIDAKELSSQLKMPVFVLNDVEANAYGIKQLSPSDFFTLNEGRDQKGNRALIAAGTGLGEAGLFWNGKEHLPFGCEGGHCDFAPRDEMEIEFLRYARKEYDHFSYERVLSGCGLHFLYRYLVDLGLEKRDKEFEIRFEKEDPAMVISEAAIKKENPACFRALRWFISIYGSEAGNVALKFFSIGGLYVGGGIAPKILQMMRDGEFMQGFLNKGRLSSVLSTIPVKVILREDTALLGAAIYIRDATF